MRHSRSARVPSNLSTGAEFEASVRCHVWAHKTQGTKLVRKVSLSFCGRSPRLSLRNVNTRTRKFVAILSTAR